MNLNPIPDVEALAEAVVRTVAYVDIFDYPLTAAEIHRYLKGMAAPAGQVQELLQNGCLVPSRLARREGYFMLPGREATVETRHQRAALAAELWPHALAYGQIIAALPFVRMVAVTGSLAVDNVESRADIDYFVITEPGRVWLSRAFTILIVRMAARRGIILCPNYFRSAAKLTFEEQTLYAAHELAQMVPLSGLETYAALRAANRWLERYLPNAAGLPRPAPRGAAAGRQRLFYRAVEAALRTPLGTLLERWEMERKIERFNRRLGASVNGSEAAFCPDWCKGHFDNHGQRTLRAYTGRVEELDAVLKEKEKQTAG